ncbi:DUF1643 domain-containing protein [Kandleria vitulina]|nr:DUF1643 domain-containing protein [Kandleria vitulina]
MNKITKHVLKYPKGEEPDFILPQKYGRYRYALGKKGTNPLVAICMNLVAICMNPSAAKEDSSDMTINRVISASEKLNHDGWIVFNLYPERATDAKNLEEFNEAISKENIDIIRRFLIEHKIKEVWGAWGNAKGIETLRLAKKDIFNMLSEISVRVFYFGTLSKEGNPRHPLQRNEKVVFADNCKKYL